MHRRFPLSIILIAVVVATSAAFVAGRATADDSALSSKLSDAQERLSTAEDKVTEAEHNIAALRSKSARDADTIARMEIALREQTATLRELQDSSGSSQSSYESARQAARDQQRAQWLHCHGLPADYDGEFEIKQECDWARPR